MCKKCDAENLTAIEAALKNTRPRAATPLQNVVDISPIAVAKYLRIITDFSRWTKSARYLHDPGFFHAGRLFPR
jgi:hypothetical protein